MPTKFGIKLRLHPHVAGYFRKRRFFPPYLKKSASTRSVFESYLTIHTQPGIFENGFFLLPIWKNLRPHVAFSNHMCGRASLKPKHDVIVFENLRSRPSTRIRWISVFKNLHLGERIWKPPFLVPENADYVWTVAVFGEKSLRFRQYPATCGRGLILTFFTGKWEWFSVYIIIIMMMIMMMMMMIKCIL